MKITKQQQNIPLNKVRVDDAFWSPIQGLVRDVVIPYQYDIMDDRLPGVEKSHAIENFRIAAGLSDGEFYGMVFQDSDVAKWLEGVAYSLMTRPDPELEAQADALIEIIKAAQQPDGYLNTFFTLKEPEHRWQNLHECHELYSAGHMMEAAVAYYEATGKRTLLDVMSSMADHICDRFGPDKTEGYPGHQEVEIGLLKMYRCTGNERYRDTAAYFLDERGKSPNFFERETAARGWQHWGVHKIEAIYNQAHIPVREQSDAVGHSVRAVYMYTAMADMAAETGDEDLYKACLRLWDSITQKRMYITGGIGSTVHGEAFTIDYDLPNDTVYAETCASIGLIFFARRMLEIQPSGIYADTIERSLYNTVLSGMQQDGTRFFYVNPLEVVPGVSGTLQDYRHVLPVRPEWYACACCPPNVTRLLTSLGQYAWGEGLDTVYSHLYLGGEVSLSIAGGVDIRCASNYPWQGKVSYTITRIADQAADGVEFTLAVHVPGWCKDISFTVNNERVAPEIKDGYAYIKRYWKTGDTLLLDMDIPVRRIYSNTAVRENAGCVALMRGPIVYCAEECDNGNQLSALRIPTDAEITGDRILMISGKRVSTGTDLYTETRPRAEDVEITAVPFYSWGNRGEGEMRVWFLEG